MRFLWIFIDGIGIGTNNPDINPFAVRPTRHFWFLGGQTKHQVNVPVQSRMKAVDATLGLPGLPQSATGQTAILTGINVCKLLSRHLSGLPTKTLKSVLNQHSILKVLTRKGFKSLFVNAFRDSYFTNPNPRNSATTLAALAAGQSLRTIKDLREGNAVYQDFTNQHLINQGYKLPIISPVEAGTTLARIAENYHFCLFEYFITDKVGHSRNMEKALTETMKIDEFVDTVVNLSDVSSTNIIVISDHGNMEDMSTRMHTANPVPLMAWGPHSDHILNNVNTIADLAPVTISLFDDTAK